MHYQACTVLTRWFVRHNSVNRVKHTTAGWRSWHASSDCFCREIQTERWRISAKNNNLLTINQFIPQSVTFMGAADRQQTMDCRRFRKDALEMFQKAVESVCPAQMVHNSLSISEDNILTVGEQSYKLKKNVYVVGFGKAVSGMARAVEDLLGDHVVKGVISIPTGSQEMFKRLGKEEFLLKENSRILVFEGAANNMPDEDAHNGALAIMKLAENVGENDILLVLISGGGSSLLPSPKDPITLKEVFEMSRILSTHGASIQQLNTIRQNIEVLKGGGLATLAKPAKVLSLILSDVIEDKLDIISSGPTVPLLSSPRQCLEIIQRLDVQDKIPPAVLHALQKMAFYRKGTQQSSPQSHKTSNFAEEWNHVQNFIIGSNSIATSAVCDAAQTLGYIPVVLTNSLEGEATAAADMFVGLAKYIALGFGERPPDQGNTALQIIEVELCKAGVSKALLKQISKTADMAYNSGRGVCIVSGGETVVNVKGNGKGGRNQEMALAFSVGLGNIIKEHKIFSKTHVEFLSAGTDGQDGPTDAAGAVVNKELAPLAVSLGMDPEDYLKNNDSYTLFHRAAMGRNLIQTGLTGTNVMDIQILLVQFFT